MGHGNRSELKDSFDTADRSAESYFKYAFKLHWDNRPESTDAPPGDDYDALDKLGAVYEKDAGVFSARNAKKACCSNRVIEMRSLEKLTAARLGCGIERDYNVLQQYTCASTIDDLTGSTNEGDATLVYSFLSQWRQRQE